MRYLMTTKGQAGGPPDEKLMIEMGKFVQDGFRTGYLIATGGLDPHATQISSAAGKITVTDGPFTEAKEAIVGFALIDVGSKDEAIELSKRFWAIVGDGLGEIRQVFGPEGPSNA
jgi:hypothetical protein